MLDRGDDPVKSQFRRIWIQYSCFIMLKYILKTVIVINHIHQKCLNTTRNRLWPSERLCISCSFRGRGKHYQIFLCRADDRSQNRPNTISSYIIQQDNITKLHEIIDLCQQITLMPLKITLSLLRHPLYSVQTDKTK